MLWASRSKFEKSDAKKLISEIRGECHHFNIDVQDNFLT
jgi:hypothetical protein